MDLDLDPKLDSTTLGTSPAVGFREMVAWALVYVLLLACCAMAGYAQGVRDDARQGWAAARASTELAHACLHALLPRTEDTDL